jgi:hypothetical protein
MGVKTVANIIPICFWMTFIAIIMFYMSRNVFGVGAYTGWFRINESAIMTKSTSSWTWRFDWDGKTYQQTCPNYIKKVTLLEDYPILHMLGNEFFNFNKIYSMTVNPDDIGHCFSFYNFEDKLISYINCSYREYSFFNASGGLLLEAELNKNNWIIKPYDWIDMDLYGSFLAYQAFYSDPSISSDDCNIVFNLLMAVEIISFIVLVVIVINKCKCKNQEPLLTQGDPAIG